MNAPAAIAPVIASQPDATHGYKAYTLGAFTFRRDEYFAHITWTTRDGRPLSHTMDVGNFLRALMRDVAWGFFYGWVNFDHVIGTVNHYKTVDFFAGSYNGTMKAAGVNKVYTLVNWDDFALEKFFSRQRFTPSKRINLEYTVA